MKGMVAVEYVGAETNTSGRSVRTCEVCGREWILAERYSRRRTCSTECRNDLLSASIKQSWDEGRLSGRPRSVRIHNGNYRSCPSCLAEKPEVEFYLTSSSRERRSLLCRDCFSAQSRRRYSERGGREQARNRRKSSDSRYRSMRNVDLKKRYGITLDDYNSILEAQDGKCICGRSAEENAWGTLGVDHCHSSGIVRGLLCYRCNMFVGVIEALRQDPVLHSRLLEHIDGL